MQGPGCGGIHAGMEVPAASPQPMAPTAPDRAMRRVALACVLVLCGGLRLWLVANTEVIARDGTELVAAARRLDRDAAKEIETGTFHPGYPACVVAVRRALAAFGLGGDDVWAWDLSGQLVSLVAALVATLGLWYFAEGVLTWRVAFLGVLVFSLTRKWSVLGADVLTDALAVCFQVWGAVLALTVARRLGAGQRRALVWAAGVGLCAAAGYLVRPEAIVMGAIAVSLWLTNLCRKRAPWRLSLAAMLITVVTTAVCAAPYMLAIGVFSRKTSVLQFIAAPAPRPAAVMLPLAVAAASDESSLYQLIGQFTTAQHLIVSFLVVICLVTWLGSRNRRIGLPQRVRIFPSVNGAILMLAAMVLSAVPLICYAGTYKLSHRYLMFQALLLSPLAGAGLAILGQWLQIAAGRIGFSVKQAKWFFAIAVAAMAAGLTIHALRPLHSGKANYRTAGAFVRRITTPDDLIAATEKWILHYSDRSEEWHLQALFVPTQRRMLKFLRTKGITHFIFCRHRNPKKGERQIDLDTPHLVHVRTFPPVDASGTTIIVYRVARRQWGPRKPVKR